MGDIMKLGQPGTNFQVTGTVLDSDSLISRLLENPGFTGQRYQAVQSFADASAIPLWQEWRAIFLDLDNPAHQADARAFFDAHREVMLQGTQVLWEARESYYDLMVMRLVEGETAFRLEKQNDATHTDQFLFDLTRAGFCTIVPEGLQRRDGRLVLWQDLVEVVAFWDPAIGQGDYPDWSSCALLCQDSLGYQYAVDAYLSQGHSPEAQVTGVAELVLRWGVTRLGFEANLFQSLLKSDVEQALAQQAAAMGGVPVPLLIPVTNTRNKMLRISTLQTPVTHRHLWFSDALPAEALRQLERFRPVEGADKDDYPDSLEGAVRVAKHLV